MPLKTSSARRCQGWDGRPAYLNTRRTRATSPPSFQSAVHEAKRTDRRRTIIMSRGTVPRETRQPTPPFAFFFLFFFSRRTEMARNVLCPRLAFLFRASPCITSVCFKPRACQIRRERMTSMDWGVTRQVSKERCVLRMAAGVSFVCVNLVILCLVGLEAQEWLGDSFL